MNAAASEWRPIEEFSDTIERLNPEDIVALIDDCGFGRICKVWYAGNYVKPEEYIKFAIINTPEV